MDKDQANDALGAVSSAQRSVAAASAAPLWRHAATALTVAAIVACTALPAPFRFALLSLALAAIFGLVQWDRRQTGMFVNGYRRGRTLSLTLGLLAAVLALTVLTLRIRDEVSIYVALLPALVALGVAFGASLWWERIFRRELGAVR